jgi:transaldolase/glucose-6-phosphate isomerase
MTTEAGTKNHLLELLDHGQSVWYDYIRRGLITSGELERLIAEDGLHGVTSNPSIWEKAIAGSTDYEDAIEELRREGDGDPKSLYERLAIQDIQDAADVFRPLYEETRRGDGFVSIEVSPGLAHDTDGTIAEAERLWQAIDRENVMVKVPATQEGIPAIRALIGRGINVNITLLFAIPVYEQVADAYMAGLEDYLEKGGDLARVASVASFFVSRIDTIADVRLDEVTKHSPSADQRALARGLEGRVAIANAKLAYQLYKELVAGERWRALAREGARVQRLLWASTSTKNPRYPDLLYVEELIGPDTVDTVPPATFEAFRQHGRARASLEEDVDAARDALVALEGLGISLEEITDKLTEDGVDLFAQAFEKLFAVLADRVATKPRIRREAQRTSLPPDIEAAVRHTIDDWESGAKVRRLWSRDATLWTGVDESAWLGWLGIAEDELAHSERLDRVARDVRDAGFEHALLLGMGGSSLCPELLSLTFEKADGHPELRILDSTDPAQVKARENEVDLAKTLFIVSSKSGTTLEPRIFEQYFFERVTEAVGADRAPKHFIAVTDPGSKLEQLAEEKGFRDIAHGVESIGGRYSALSDFGMVPGAAMGIDVHELLDRAERMAHSCAACVPATDNPGLVLGAIIGVCASHGRDKLTLVTSPAIRDLGAWLEQLLAESTGKRGKGVIPIDREPLGAPDAYGDDRVFVYVRLGSDPDAQQDAAVEAIERDGQPVVTVLIDDLYDLGGELFRWEFATAVAGSLIGINPFDQPDVEASKVVTRELTSEYARTGALPAESPIATDGGLSLYADGRNAAELDAASDGDTLEELLRAHLARVGAGDYVALLAYLEMTPQHEQVLTEIRRAVRDRTRAATCVGFGPRFLHSTGQAYKGGPSTGVFLQITCDDPEDVAVPGERYTFGVVKAAEARGDFQVLADRGRRALRIHLGDVDGGLAAARDAIERALPRRSPTKGA